MRISDWSSDVVLFRSPSDYGISCVGSRAMAGLLDANMLAARDHTGETLAEGLARMGAQASAIPGVQRARNSTAAYLELDRKSVVEGKSVSVRVDLGGRRIIKKTKKT